MKYIIEIATTDFPTTRAAAEGGADRIELCAALSEGGITPSHGMILRCRESFDVALFPMIRPRAGDFLYSDDEFRVMQLDVAFCRKAGCEGVVFGMLKRNGDMDLQRMAKLVELAYPMEVTIHRAFDRCRDPFAALEELVNIGCQRILSSGQAATAENGLPLIAKLVEAADDRIIIMPGSGVRKENIRTLAAETGAREFHSSLKGVARSAMEFVHPDLPESGNASIDPAEVKALRNALNI
ncbi:MAG TPA: copper homeostasis protein CutC [Chitinophagaceae bacterium]